jgi:hypothetical protein
VQVDVLAFRKHQTQHAISSIKLFLGIHRILTGVFGAVYILCMFNTLQFMLCREEEKSIKELEGSARSSRSFLNVPVSQ